MLFAGKRALVTGAGKGIGKGIVSMLVTNGVDSVVAISRTQADLDELTQLAPQKVRGISLDLGDRQRIDNIFKNKSSASDTVGDVDLLVNNAGIALNEPFLQAKMENFSKTMEINVGAALRISQLCAQNMIQRGVGGSIVNVSSQASMIGLKNHAAYCSSKGALDQLTRVMALELGPQKIRCNAVNPTVVLTDMGRENWQTGTPEADAMLQRIPLGRFAEVEEVANVVKFLLCPDASMVNGVTIPIDGGLLAT